MRIGQRTVDALEILVRRQTERKCGMSVARPRRPIMNMPITSLNFCANASFVDGLAVLFDPHTGAGKFQRDIGALAVLLLHLLCQRIEFHKRRRHIDAKRLVPHEVRTRRLPVVHKLGPGRCAEHHRSNCNPDIFQDRLHGALP